MPYWKQVVTAFMIGACLGVLAGSRGRLWGSGGRRGPDVDRILRKLDRELGLDAKQKEGLKAVLEKSRARIIDLRREMSSRFDEVRESMRSDIKALLTPEQRGKFEAMAARWDARRRKFQEKEGGQDR